MSLETMNYEKIGAFIAMKRKEKNLTQLQLGQVLGVTDRAVSKWERAKSFPDIGMLKPLCAALDVSVAELLEGEESCRQHFTREETDEAALRGINTYAARWKKKELLNRMILAVFIFLLLLAAAAFWKQKQPVDFEKADLKIKSAAIQFQDGEQKWFSFSGASDQSVAGQITDILRETRRMEQADRPQYAFQNAWVKFEGIGTFYQDGYFDERSRNYYTCPQDIYDKLYSILEDYAKQQTYVYKGPYDFSIGGRNLSVKVPFTEKREELLIDYYLEQLAHNHGGKAYSDAYIRRIEILSITWLSEEEYRALDDFEQMRKEIDYYDIYDYRVCRVVTNQEYTQSLKQMGPQSPDGISESYFLIGKKEVGDMASYEICYRSMPRSLD